MKIFSPAYLLDTLLPYKMYTLSTTCLDVIPSIVTEFQTRRHVAGNLVSHNNGAKESSRARSEAASLLVSPQLRCGVESLFTMRCFN